MNHGEIGPWELTPAWHWRSWFGWDLRRYIVDYNFHIGYDRWEFGRPEKVAREMLHSAYGEKPATEQVQHEWYLSSITDYFKRSNVT